MKSKSAPVIYQAKNGEIEFRGDLEHDTVWGNLQQIADLFGRDKSVISRHIKNVFRSGELSENSVVAKIATTAADGKTYQVDYYNLDMILSVGYRVDSRQSTRFRIWATKTLKQHLLKGYTINKKQIGKNYEKFMQAVSNTKALLPAGHKVKAEDALEIIKAFANTWFSLAAYDKDSLPKSGTKKRRVKLTAKELSDALLELKKDLLKKKEATNLFGKERQPGNLKGIVGNVLQSAFGKDVYTTKEEKDAHLLYFIVKDHPFVDGNKRNGAFAFVWFLRKSGILQASLTPEALTALTLLVAESDPKNKSKLIALIVLLLNERYKK